MKSQTDKGSPSAAVTPIWSLSSRRRCAAPCPERRWERSIYSQPSGQLGRGLPTPSRKGAGVWLPA
jgi:hypothetical protein